ncbi:xanthine dehydrogenase family protein molybdopterin-binding subunit [Aquimarina sp. U1-2]|uniref:xanthine dehydrogenase family protein molybdopterin-binding subunit n=1 Tax=Aquimarina sp. U1-2 TaxID=2823141 RepID=UPI001AECD7A7|nr:xanthine dehydrogenase family protein molybdopterin-binding subunit [Aquimarina sp. U1-2]MBP2831234.1 xanthine dehydrogenase family protein molybdopterin-binding subunit [Aquimarina sp. U1-2]
MEQISQPKNRVDGRAKVTGQAKYCNDIEVDNLSYGYLLSATITKGKIIEIDTEEASNQKGVIKIFTHLNMPRLYKTGTRVSAFLPSDDSGQQTHVPLQDENIYYDLQYVALVVAETFEIAQEAAGLIKVLYSKDPVFFEEHPNPEKGEELELLYEVVEGQYERGEPDKAFSDSTVKIEREFTTQTMHHNPMERHGTTAIWDNDFVTIYEPSAWVFGHRKGVSEMLGIPQEKVRVISTYVGGAFGGKGLTAPHTAIAAVAAKETGRPIRMELTRKQLFGVVGFRSATYSKVKMGAEKDGTINVVDIEATAEAPSFQNTIYETTVMSPRHMYNNKHMRANMMAARNYISGSVPMRSPGESSGMFLLESMIDELAYEVDIDPIEIRRKNNAEINLDFNIPWSSKYLMECFDKGAEKFGWKNRNSKIGSMRKNGMLIGYGVASSTYPTLRVAASAKARLNEDGTLEVLSATHEIGTGTYTIVSQIAADAMSYPIEKIKAKMGDTVYPKSPPSVAGFTVASTGTAVMEVCNKLKDYLIELAVLDPQSPLYKKDANAVQVSKGVMTLGNDTDSFVAVVKRSQRRFIETSVDSAPGPDRFKYSSYSFGANFVEVEIDPITCWAKINRVVGVYDAGKIVNPKTAHSQLVGGCVFAIGMAMQEATERDLTTGRYINADLGGYHMPVQADIPDLDLSFLPYDDKKANPLAIKSVGELGGVGLQAAIMNAIYHASGVRLRSLPYKPEKLLGMTIT